MTSHKKSPKANLIYAADNPQVASFFTFNWDDNMGIKLKEDEYKSDKWTLFVPKRLKNLLNKPCSIYEVDTKPFKKTGGEFPEYISSSPVGVISENKFKSTMEAIKKNGGKVVISDIIQDYLSKIQMETHK